MSSTIGSDHSNVLLSDNDENYSMDEINCSSISEGVAIPIKSFYGLRCSSNTFYRSPKLTPVSIGPSYKSKQRPERRIRLQSKQPFKKKVLKTGRTKLQTVQRKTESSLNPREITIKSHNSFASTPRKFFKDRSKTEYTLSPVFNPKCRLPLAPVLPLKNKKVPTDQNDKKIRDQIQVSTPVKTGELKMTANSDQNTLQNEILSTTCDLNVANILDELLDGHLNKEKTLEPTRITLRRENDDKSQMMIDVGQKNVESILCKKCGMLYVPNSEEDSALHFKFHNERFDIVSFNGWKSERVVREYVDGRVILILPSDPKYALNKVAEVRLIIDNSLGMTEKFALKPSVQTFLFVHDKKVVGCVIAEAISKASPVIVRQKLNEPLCCSAVVQRAVCGINRIWVATAYRRKKIASRLIDCVKANFYYGCVISDDELAFSGPSPSGQLFAENYMKRKSYLVYDAA
ncbi:Establishment of cohesion 1 [Chamberlinius hualienensis]